MFVGHAMAAFALVAGAVLACGDRTQRRVRTRVLTFGAVAAAFAAVPDVDIVYALVGLVGAGGGMLAHAAAFWATGNVVHRSVTHSLVVAPAVAGLAGLVVAGFRTGDRHRRALVAGGATVAAAAVVAVTVGVAGPLGGAVAAAFVLAAAAVAVAVARYTPLGPPATAGLALVGLLTHPFGDLTTGQPPAMLFPLETTVVADRVVLSSDPTLHLLGAFGLELATVWAAVLVFAMTRGGSLREALDPRAALGVAYAASVLVVPPPTLSLSYQFVFSVLAVGTVGVAPRVDTDRRRLHAPDPLSAVVTGLAAVTVAGGAYAVAYLLGVAG